MSIQYLFNSISSNNTKEIICVPNVLHGKGTLTWKSLNQDLSIFEGNFVYGKINGKGKYEILNLENNLKKWTVYGIWKDNIPITENESWKIIFETNKKSKVKYEGEIKITKKNVGNRETFYEKKHFQRYGTGEIVASNKVTGKVIVRYYGSLKRTLHGFGVYENENEKYYGNFRNGCRNGSGCVFYKNCSFFKGKWKDNQKFGKGKLFLPNGDVIVGKWKNDKIILKGKLIRGNLNNLDVNILRIIKENLELVISERKKRNTSVINNKTKNKMNSCKWKNMIDGQKLRTEIKKFVEKNEEFSEKQQITSLFSLKDGYIKKTITQFYKYFSICYGDLLRNVEENEMKDSPFFSISQNDVVQFLKTLENKILQNWVTSNGIEPTGDLKTRFSKEFLKIVTCKISDTVHKELYPIYFQFYKFYYYEKNKKFQKTVRNFNPSIYHFCFEVDNRLYPILKTFEPFKKSIIQLSKFFEGNLKTPRTKMIEIESFRKQLLEEMVENRILNEIKNKYIISNTGLSFDKKFYENLKHNVNNNERLFDILEEEFPLLKKEDLFETILKSREKCKFGANDIHPLYIYCLLKISQLNFEKEDKNFVNIYSHIKYTMDWLDSFYDGPVKSILPLFESYIELILSDKRKIIDLKTIIDEIETTIIKSKSNHKKITFYWLVELFKILLNERKELNKRKNDYGEVKKLFLQKKKYPIFHEEMKNHENIDESVKFFCINAKIVGLKDVIILNEGITVILYRLFPSNFYHSLASNLEKFLSL